MLESLSKSICAKVYPILNSDKKTKTCSLPKNISSSMWKRNFSQFLINSCTWTITMLGNVFIHLNISNLKTNTFQDLTFNLFNAILDINGQLNKTNRFIS